MARKRVAAIVKIQIPAGKASPAPPVGTALGPHGVAIMDFCKAYNAATEAQRGTIVPVDITVFEDRSFTFVLKTPPTPVLLRAAAGLDKGSTAPGKTQAGTVTEAQVGTIVPVEITVFEDRSFSFILKTPPTPVLLRQKAGLEKASQEPGRQTVGRVTEADVAEIAQIKMPDLNAYDLEAAKQQVRGTARSMGIDVVG